MLVGKDDQTQIDCQLHAQARPFLQGEGQETGPIRGASLRSSQRRGRTGPGSSTDWQTACQ